MKLLVLLFLYPNLFFQIPKKQVYRDLLEWKFCVVCNQLDVAEKIRSSLITMNIQIIDTSSPIDIQQVATSFPTFCVDTSNFKVSYIQNIMIVSVELENKTISTDASKYF